MSADDVREILTTHRVWAVVDPEATAFLARAVWLRVVMDRCPAIELPRL